MKDKKKNSTVMYKDIRSYPCSGETSPSPNNGAGYEAIMWLTSKVFLDREFISRIEEHGFQAIYQECPYHDLTPEQRAAFEAAFSRWELRILVRIWWVIYERLRNRNKIPSASAPEAAWRP